MSRNRDIEWLLATLLLALGLTIVLLPHAFLAPFFAGYSGQGIPEDPLGTGMACVGMLWTAGLKVNGSWPGGTPWIRLACAILGSGVWGYLFAGIALSGATASLSLYGVIIAFSLLACARCGADAAKSLMTRRKLAGRKEAARHVVG
ncbi:hypothetical protein GCM10007874_09910 [Labrys miyagiensis]|uniref:Transmembrane protein n=1 Tax=Labrys miyagiensis TaxID=346912 RepID=A0ABQ6CCW2_9HYPH|nr:hypothetical protein [Labrys miyagiensis]GLS17975.1 hypothetical protein GCM10007874_09910 [Labrys miyagiensis]